MTAILVPAFNKTYKNKTEVIDDWTSGKSFRISGSNKYVSILNKKMLIESYDRVYIISGNIKLEVI